MNRGGSRFVSLSVGVLLAACRMEPDTHPAAPGGLRASLTGESTSEAALLVGNLANPAPRAGNGILRYNAGTRAFIDAIVPEGSGPTGNPLLGPCCMVFGPDENLYVSNLLGVALTDRGVFRYNGVTGEFMDVFVPGNSGGLRRPLVVVFGPDGNLYVGDVGNVAQGGTAIRRYNGLTGAFLGVFVAPGAGGMTQPGDPQFFVFGPDGNLYVASAENNGNGSVLRYDGHTGAFLGAFVPTGTGGISGPRALLFKEKITICHRPPGNPAKAKSISIGYLSAGDHLAHGDLEGACQ